MNGFLILAAVLAGTCLHPNRAVKPPARGDLATLVQKIEQACPDVKQDDQDLLDDLSMKQLHDHPEPYFDQAILLVRDARASLAAKLIVVYGMQCLALKKYGSPDV